MQSPSYNDSEVCERVDCVPDNEAKECFYCQTKFTAIKCRHRCRYKWCMMTVDNGVLTN